MCISVFPVLLILHLLLYIHTNTYRSKSGAYVDPFLKLIEGLQPSKSLSSSLFSFNIYFFDSDFPFWQYTVDSVY